MEHFIDSTHFHIWKTLGPFLGDTHSSNSLCDDANRVMLTPLKNRVYISQEVSDLLFCNWLGFGRMWNGKKIEARDILELYRAEHIGTP